MKSEYVRPGVAALPALSPAVLRETVDAALQTVAANLAFFGDRFPDHTTRHNLYLPHRAELGALEGGNSGWTTGFWTGQLWLAHELSGEARFLTGALRHVDSFAQRAARRVDVDHHDLGFLYSLSCIPAVRLSGSAPGRAAALEAAELLMERYWERVGIIQAWGDLADPSQRGRIIIDCLMNLPLLHWAARETGQGRYREAAHRHAALSCRYLVRGDDSSFHTFYFDVQTGGPRYGKTHQGAGDDTCWARGQAWGIYGFALNHALTGDAAFLHVARRQADYFLARVPSDGVVYWDLSFADGDGQEKDSSASAIAACGLLELARWCPDAADRERYRTAGLATVRALVDGYATRDAPTPGPLLRHGVYGKPQGSGVNEGNLWGDYFYLEALTRLTRDWAPYWL